MNADLAVLDSSKASEVALLHALLGEEKKRTESISHRLHVYQGDVDAIHSQLHSIDYCDIVLHKLQHSKEFIERRRVSPSLFIFLQTLTYQFFVCFFFCIRFI